jgi:peptidyl-prolyl cis-trans isomerase A (cyclophilin A)/peptidyl-prolyl cis-trans isomerase B (cyclophilin B)
MSLPRFFASLLLACSAMFAVTCSAQAADAAPRVLLKTNMGNIVFELYPEQAPKTVENFLSYVKSGYYKGTIFHRVIDGFMIQGGGFDKNMKPKSPKKPIENEAKNGLKNERYTVAMARSGAPHSATSQFFINVNDNTGLDYPGQDGWGYCVFGKVVDGADVVDKIAKVPVGSQGMYDDVPNEPVIIQSASVVK